MRKSAKILEVDDIHASHHRKEILHGVSLNVSAGETVGLIGPNGAGKSTLLKTIVGLLKMTGGSVSGKVQVGGRDVTSLLPSEKAKMGVRYLLQGGEVFPNLSVEENLALSSRGNGGEFADQRKIISSLFPMLDGIGGKKAGLLSGGERQMLAISMVLIVRPRLLLLDEPSASLAPALAEIIFSAISRIKDELGSAVLLVEQNIDECLALSDRVYLMSGGRLVDEDTPTDLLNSGKVEKLFFS
jgi:ABC-type branched-chain amino acid transport systems, ATPase component